MSTCHLPNLEILVATLYFLLVHSFLNDLGAAITLFEAYYYPNEATSDPVC